MVNERMGKRLQKMNELEPVRHIQRVAFAA
jgi:hypothetical protein